MTSELMIEVSRGALTENRHYGHLVVTDTEGKIIKSRGNPKYVTYFRSAAKPIQAMEVILSGAADRYQFSNDQISIMCASHYGEDLHRQTVTAILSKTGLEKKHLQCGATTSLNSDYAIQMALKGYGPDVLFNDCSGKHAGFLAICRQKNYDTQHYIDLHHPLQTDISTRIAEMCQMDVNNIIHGIDGCGVPVHGMPLSRMAAGYANLAAPGRLKADDQLAAESITQAMRAHPEMLSGTGGFCTALNRATNGRIFGKIGAEAVYCVGNMDAGQGLAIKLEDGNLWRLAPIVMKTLTDLKWLKTKEIASLENFVQRPNRNKHNQIVGYVNAI